MHSLQPQQNAQLRPRGHDENILEEAYRGRYARQRLLNFWPESSCGYHAIKRFVCIIQVEINVAARIAGLPRVPTASTCRRSKSTSDCKDRTKTHVPLDNPHPGEVPGKLWGRPNGLTFSREPREDSFALWVCVPIIYVLP